MAAHSTKKLVLVTKGERNLDFLTNQLKDLIGDQVIVDGICVDKPFSPVRLDCDLVVLSFGSLEEQILPYVNRKESILVARRAINSAYVDKLLRIPAKTRAMVVNTSQETSQEVISQLYGLGFHELWLIPFYPGMDHAPQVDMAITPDEEALVPSGIGEVVNIGTRIIDLTTMTEILVRLDLLDGKANILSAKYMNQIIELSKKISASLSHNSELNTLLETIINKVHDGIIAVDAGGKIVLCNQLAQKLIKFSPHQLVGAQAEEIIPELKMTVPLKTGNSEESIVESYKGKEIMVNRIALGEADQPRGAVLVFKEIEQLERMELTLRRHLKKKGHVAKYSFSDICGTSQEIRKALNLAKKFAPNDLTVLFLGETGTGKELFASAMHSASRRSKQPFVAVNCAALPRDLLESELFGYEEGAFTGAKRGGKPGLFEIAHLGTIFLDEIGEISPETQAKLLRVLEEKEVMRLGSEMIIPVDVRVIAATNKNIRDLADKGSFRKDLYYRLNAVTIYLPSLRERLEDIIALSDLFLKRYKLSVADFFSPAVQRHFQLYSWPGNIRELKNVLEFLVNVVNGRKVELVDLPPDMYPLSGNSMQTQLGNPSITHQKKGNIEKIRREEELLILRVLTEGGVGGGYLGRKRINMILQRDGIDITEDMIRTRLQKMKKAGLVEISRGRKGTAITEKGYELLKSHLT